MLLLPPLIVYPQKTMNFLIILVVSCLGIPFTHGSNNDLEHCAIMTVKLALHSLKAAVVHAQHVDPVPDDCCLFGGSESLDLPHR